MRLSRLLLLATVLLLAACAGRQDGPAEVADGPSGRDLTAADVADALEDMVADAPDQWYTFKPMWPETELEAAELEQRARAVGADRA